MSYKLDLSQQTRPSASNAKSKEPGVIKSFRKAKMQNKTKKVKLNKFFPVDKIAFSALLDHESGLQKKKLQFRSAIQTWTYHT